MVQFRGRLLCTVTTVCAMNLLINLDHMTVAGILPDIKTAFNLDNGLAGLIQTVFVCCLALFAPLFGYLGDRYNRKVIMSLGLIGWSLLTLGLSFVARGRQNFWLFILLHGCSGIAVASYAAISPTIIADLFTGRKRSILYTIYYLGTPVGSALGYLFGTFVAKATKSWRIPYRISPIFGAVIAILCITFNIDPPRGQAEFSAQIASDRQGMQATRWITDFKNIFQTRTFVWSTIGWSCQYFATGAVAFWAPTYIYNLEYALYGNISLARIGLTFGIILCVAGIFGVFLGAEIAKWFKKYDIREGDAFACAIGMGISGVSIYAALFLSVYSMTLAWILVFVSCFALFIIFAPNADILMLIITPARRATAEAFQITTCHLAGDAISPYIIGAIADAITTKKDPISQSYALRYSMMISSFVCIVGCGFFLLASLTLVSDQDRMILETEASVTADNKQNIAETDETIAEKLPILS